jgi:5,10-methylenetetrahydromethanopterin reductase
MDIDLILEPDLTPSEIKELGVAAEAFGVRTLWASNYSSARDAFMSLLPLAGATKRIGIGVLVVSPWEMHPLKIANSLLTLNEYAGGRARLVVSGGGEWCGVMGTGHGRRVRAVRETVEMIRRATTGKPLTYKGELYKSYGYNAAWARDPAPQVYVGASKPQMMRMAAEVADGAMMSDVTLHYIRDMTRIAQEHLAEVGREGSRDRAADPSQPVPPGFRLSNFWAWHVKADRAASMKEARRELILRGWLVRYHLEPFLTPEECDLVEKHKNAFLAAYTDRSGEIRGVPPALVDKLIENFSCAGDLSTIDRHVATIRRFADSGLTELALRLHDEPMNAVRMLGERVLPALR